MADAFGIIGNGARNLVNGATHEKVLPITMGATATTAAVLGTWSLLQQTGTNNPSEKAGSTNTGVAAASIILGSLGLGGVLHGYFHGSSQTKETKIVIVVCVALILWSSIINFNNVEKIEEKDRSNSEKWERGVSIGAFTVLGICAITLMIKFAKDRGTL
jgi:hypothetical protein